MSLWQNVKYIFFSIVSINCWYLRNGKGIKVQVYFRFQWNGIREQIHFKHRVYAIESNIIIGESNKQYEIVTNNRNQTVNASTNTNIIILLAFRMIIIYKVYSFTDGLEILCEKRKEIDKNVQSTQHRTRNQWKEWINQMHSYTIRLYGFSSVQKKCFPIHLLKYS